MDISHIDNDPAVDTLRISDRQADALLAGLDDQPSARRGNAREDERLVFRERGRLIVRILHLGGSIANYLVKARNISRSGIAFLHGSYLYDGTPCTINLPTTDGGYLAIDGRVVRCRHVSGNIHEVGLWFDAPISLQRLLVKQTTPVDEPVQAEREHRVLVIEPVPEDRQFVALALAGGGVTALAAEDMAAGADLLATHPVHAAIVGVSDPPDTQRILQSLRAVRYGGPVVAITAAESFAQHRAMMDAGVTTVLCKPFSPERLVGVLKTQLHPNDDQTIARNEHLSAHWPDAQLRPLIEQFVDRLDTRLDEIQHMADLGLSIELSAALLQLKGTAGNLGYPHLSELCRTLSYAALDEQHEEIEFGLDELRRRAEAAGQAIAEAAR